VSRDARGDQPGALTTPLLELDKGLKSMTLNAAVEREGEIRVQVRDAAGGVVEGFSFDACRSIQGDSVRLPVEWENHSLGELAGSGRNLRFEFRIRQASVFGFDLADGETP
jgi:hypothetical protein